MKINSDQKSVLILFGIFFFGSLYAGGLPAVISLPAIIFWIALGAWFYGVRTKLKPN
jgi:hypothetical protein